MRLRPTSTLLWLAAIGGGLTCALHSTSAQDSAFSYQGFFTDQGVPPAHAIYDLRFTLYDTDGLPPNVGNAVVAPVELGDVGVTNGLFTVTLNFGASPFNGNSRWLEIGVRPGASTGGYTILTPRQPITATPYAIRSANFSGPVTASQITGTLAATNIGAGTISSSNLTAGTAAANLSAAGQSAVASGGLVLSAKENSALLSAGYIRIGTTTTADAWQQRVNGTAPSARTYHTAVWTGCEMIVWGGGNGSYFNDGSRYNPAANSWTAVGAIGAPAVRYLHSAVWTGNEMIVWGGIGNSGNLNDGGRYDPVGNSWTAVSTTGAPAGRYAHTAVWTGSEMILWGGFNVSYFNDGGRYNPARNSWTPIANTLANRPSARSGHTAVWTGNEMIVWGGANSSSLLNDGGRYNPAEAGTWTAIPNTLPNTPVGRNQHSAVWTGSEMIIWGGDVGSFVGLNTGGRYNPLGNTWKVVSTTDAPAARREHRAVWTGSEMIVWGGYGNTASPFLSDGGRYHPLGNSWTAVTTVGAPAGRYGHTALWAGSEMIIWGGTGSSALNQLGRYDPSGNRWTAATANGLPTPRSGHTAVWTGSEMIVWGGLNGGFVYNDGARYNPAANTWTVLSATALGQRYRHTAVWTGSEMIIWGGFNGNPLNDGARYNPVANNWTSVTTDGGIAHRQLHTAVWTGSEMIIWGGIGNGLVPLNDGGRYNPAGNTWTLILNNLASTPSARAYHTAVWTGSEMIIWGGIGAVVGVNDGGRYNPAGAGTWTAVNTTGAPTARQQHTAVWTGSEMIVWGGYNTGLGTANLNDGGRYNPAGIGNWMAVATNGAPSGRRYHTAVWTGSEMIVWGGTPVPNKGARYTPADNSWTAVTSTGAPSTRSEHTAVWTGSEMIIWGGDDGGSRLNDTFSYTPGRVLYLYQRL